MSKANPRALRICACAGSFTLWHYHLPESIDTVFTDGYWDDLCCMRAGDILIIESNHGDEMTIKLFAVTSEMSVVGLLQ